MIKILRNTLHCQGKGSWLKIQFGLTCILFMAFWRKPNEDGWSICVNFFGHGSNRFGLWFFRANKCNASFYWCTAILAVFLLTGCGRNSTVTTPKPSSTTTITKTTKTTELKPVLEPKTVVSTQTVTLDANGKVLAPAADLHKVEVVPPTPTKTPTPRTSCDKETPEWVKAMHLKEDPNCKDGICK